MSKNTQDELGVDTTSDHRRVVVVGGGLAGLSAAAALPKAGLLLMLLNQGGIVVGVQPLLRIHRMGVLLMPVSMLQWDVARTF